MNNETNAAITVEDPVIKNHRVYGQPLLPGLAYVDLLLRWARRTIGLDYKDLCLKRLVIANPLIVSGDRPVKLRISAETAAGYREIRVEGTETDPRGDPLQDKSYITAELHEGAVSFDGQIDIAAMKKSASGSITMAAVYARARKRGLEHRGMMKAGGRIHLADRGCLVRLNIKKEHQAGAGEFIIHPALIDGAAMAADMLIAKAENRDNEDLYLPLHYHSFSCLEPLQTGCWALVDLSTLRTVNDLRTLDLLFFNGKGKQVAQLQGITAKRVRSKGQINPGLKTPESFAKQFGGSRGSLPLALGESPKALRVSPGHIENRLREILAKYLNQAAFQVDPGTVFFELGLESSQLLAVLKDIETAFDLSLSPTLLFENNNLSELAGYLAKKLPETAPPEHREHREHREERQEETSFSAPALSPGSGTYLFYEHEAYLQDHLIYGQPALMGITHPCLVLETYQANHPGTYPVELKHIRFLGGPVTLEKREHVYVQVQFANGNSRTGFETVHYKTGPGQAQPCCRGEAIGPLQEQPTAMDTGAMISHSTPVPRETVNRWYGAIKHFTLGPMLQTIDEAYVYNKSTVIVKTRLANRRQKEGAPNFVFDPLLLHTCYFFRRDDGEEEENIFIPLMIERFRVFQPAAETVYIVNSLRSRKPGYVSFDALVLTETGECIAQVLNASVKEVLNPAQLSNANFQALPAAAPVTVTAAPRQSDTRSAGIAIVGMAGRYPKSYDLDAFWDNLRDGSECIAEIPMDRWDWRDYYSADRGKAGSISSKWGGFIDGVDRFDPLFFNISPREAETMDPQERLFLEHCWLALEDAGYTRESLQHPAAAALPGQVGVYVGVMSQEYPLFAAESSLTGRRFGLGGGLSSVATRVSYFCNFFGPSMAIDTMCSSSLTALHMACRALKDNTIDAALAGGVNLSLHPNKYLLLSQERLISSKSHSESFGQGSDGYIPGEGVGVLFLKRLPDALRDHDHIYAVIKGSAVNHGGTGSGYLVPKPKGQAAVVSRALEESGIHPGTISYMEAHGTGTKLGDPVEIAALTNAFARHTEKKQYCRLGSVKSNIGHGESAAGIAGVTKVLLQMKYGKIVPSLHSGTVNPDIDFAATPFILNRELGEWERTVQNGREQPRRAGIHSFGAGGVNAHVLIEEYIPPGVSRPLPVGSGQEGPKIGLNTKDPAIILLSARNEERLRERVRQLQTAIAGAEPRYAAADLADMAYTLQVGREAMEERLALMVGSMAELEEKLEAFMANRDNVPHLYRGQPDRSKETLSAFNADEDMEKTIAAWLGKKKYPNLLKLWVTGLNFDWNTLYGDIPHRISLPGYPFARERCWVPFGNSQTAARQAAGSLIHPLLQQNTSDLREQRFTTVFTGEEFFLSGHIVAGKRILPGVTYLEMARAAVARATGIQDDGPTAIRLEKVVWIVPLRVEAEPVRVHIGLVPRDNGQIDYKIYSGSEPEILVYNQGIAVPGEIPEIPGLDLDGLRARCKRPPLTPEQCYAPFRQMGFAVGPADQGLETVYVGDGQILARLKLPDIVANTREQFFLHPSLLDSALIAAVNLMIIDSGHIPDKPLLPFVLEEIEILRGCPGTRWAFIRGSDGSSPQDNIRKWDLDLADETGAICARLKGFSFSTQVNETVRANETAAEAHGTAFPGEIPGGSPRENLAAALKYMVSRLLKVNIEQIDADTELNRYGFDSLRLTEFANTLNREYQIDVLPTLFFRHPTLHGITGSLLETYPGKFTPKFGAEKIAVPPSPSAKQFLEPGSWRSRFTSGPGFSLGKRTPDAPEAVAIIGISGKFPGSRDVDELWENLVGGKDCISEIPLERWDWREYYGDPAKEKNKTDIKWGGFIDGVDEFDSLFFGISPREAELMDPQQRLLMTYVWKAIEDAGYSSQSLSGTKTALIVGTAGVSGYRELISGPGTDIESYTATGMLSSMGPNRMSYFLNLHGPSEPIETACSSSLIAIHRSVGAIRSGACEMAIAGGVNTILTPRIHISMSKAGSLAKDGRCKTFSSKADGYVRSEGVGMLFLKTLRDAELAGDHIYGVIRASAENHGGRANSVTAPNPQAQAELLQTVYTEAGIDPRTVGYIEAHGTGTELGDPIEIEGLKTAFRELYRAGGDTRVTRAHCALGSLKANVGHMELTAGAAGVIKVLLQLKHGTLPGILHCDTLNPYIQLEGSPFYILQKTEEWKALQDSSGRDLPRRAGISSFGIGGANAHVVIEEYIPPGPGKPQPAVTAQDPALIVLSAKGAAQLRERVRQLADALRDRQYRDTALPGIAYTLQVGRDAMEERLALIVASVKELEEKLAAYLAGEKAVPGLYRGRANDDKETFASFATDDEMREAVDKWIRRKKYAKLLDLWVKGLILDWTKLHRENKPHRISLPTYPFAAERFRVPGPDTQSADRAAISTMAAAIHPLLQQNTSDLSVQRFTSTFTGQEFFLADHVVKGRRILPGVAYLEMARAAVEQAVGNPTGKPWEIRLKNVVWAQPLEVEASPVQVHIDVFPADGGNRQLAYEIYSTNGKPGTGPVVHSQGSALLNPKNTAPATPAPHLDVPALQARCNQRRLSSRQCYDTLRTLGLDYGPGHRGIETLYLGTSQVLARLSLPPSVANTRHRFVLHPAMIDAALQASFGLSTGPGHPGPGLPFALEELEITGNCTVEMWAHIRSREGGPGPGPQKLDIDVCDENGVLCVRLKGLSSRPPGGKSSEEDAGLTDQVQTALLQTAAQVLKVPVEYLDPQADLDEHGFDPVTLAGFASTLNREYLLELTPRLFSQHPTLTGIAGYLVKEYRDVLAKRYPAGAPKAPWAAREHKTGPAAAQAAAQDLHLEKAVNYFKRLLASGLKLPANRIDADAPMEKYGIDSLMVMQLTNQLEKTFGSLSKTLFFEYRSIRELTAYFLESYREQLVELLGIEESSAAPSTVSGGTAAMTTPAASIRHSGRRHRFASPGLAEPGENAAGALDIAIIGLSGRYPQARNIQEFWKNLRDGRDCITEIPKDRWDHSLYFDKDKDRPGKTYSKWGGFLKGVAEFDPLFFKISPREAEIMDPQERLFLQCVFETLEDAGYTRESLEENQTSLFNETLLQGVQGDGLLEKSPPGRRRQIGVFVGVMYEEYQLYGAREQIQGRTPALAGNPSSIANRVSYFCNFHGPSMAVDTMCSSSLTTIHLACQSLKRGECRLAVAGGVNISIHPNKYLILGQGKFVSSKGRCESFGQGGDGYVPGEGVGAVLLKPLARAIADGDHIYGIIKATAINHGGKTNGYSVPNPNAQANVIGQTFKEAGIDPGTLSYIEAHGTGTSLGDPIEITGLSSAFREHTRAARFCAIGSAKSNIGHCESAAGIAGVTKVLLQLKYRQLVPSLHSREPNPNIDFSTTPFVVQQELAEWKRPNVTIDGETREYPRRAGISAFGAGGSNAHVLIEEYIPGETSAGFELSLRRPGGSFEKPPPGPPQNFLLGHGFLNSIELEEPARLLTKGSGQEGPQVAINPENPAIIVLSARNETRLHEQARRLSDFIAAPDPDLADVCLADMAYTLQVGREAMEERLALVVNSIAQLREKLDAFLAGRDDGGDLYRGQAKGNKEALAVFAADEELQEAVNKWIQRGKYGKLLDLWVKGMAFDWNKLHGDRKPRRISLPTYPFAREHYWAPGEGSGTGSLTTGPASPASLHPLLQQNTSNLSCQRFTSTFTGREFFLADHVVKGRQVLPGVATLEMARAAVQHAVEEMAPSGTGIRLKNVVWTRPIVREGPFTRVHIELFPEPNGEIGYEIYGDPEGVDGEPVVHCQGSAVLGPVSGAAEAVAPLDLPALQAQCSRGSLSSAQCYETFRTMGLDYGPAHQGIKQVLLGPGQALARLSLPSSLAETFDHFVLHPGLLDSAWQASIGLMPDPENAGSIPSLKPVLPFALQELEILDNCTPEMWALVRYSNGSQAEDNLQKMDIDICNESGTLCVRMKGLSTRVLEEAPLPESPAEVEVSKIEETYGTYGTLMLHPVWQEQAIPPGTAAPGYSGHTVIFCEPGKRWKLGSWEVRKLGNKEEGSTPPVKTIELHSPRKGAAERFQSYALQLFAKIRGILKGKPKSEVLLQVVVPVKGDKQLFSGLSGLLKTARLEDPKFRGQLIEVEPGDNPEGIRAKLEENSRCPGDVEIRYRDGKRWVAGWSEQDMPNEDVSLPLPWKDRGIYLITGGAGGLGLIFAGEILRRVKDVTLVLTGRSPLGKEKQAQLKALQAPGNGARIEYRQVDVTRKEAVTGLIKSITGDFGGLHGIIHSAGVLRDSFILKKSKEEFQEVLAPKVTGVVNLDQASQDLPLDFFIFFSSGSGALGNPGQAGYAAANAFMDAYAGYRSALTASKKRRGQTLSMDWPLWKEGGMHVDEEIVKMMEQSTGMTPMRTAVGIRALYRGLTAGKDQVMVMEGRLAKMKEKLHLSTPPLVGETKNLPAAAGAAPGLETGAGSLPDQVQNALKQTVAKLLKVKIENIDVDAEFNEHGFDSVTLTEFANALNREYGLELAPTLFFEYPTLQGLGEYLLAKHNSVFAARFSLPPGSGWPAAGGPDPVPTAAGETKVTRSHKRHPRFAGPMAPSTSNPGSAPPEPVAIIGISGRFPRAADIDEFWENLVSAKDCIGEIPADRWDWREYWGDPTTEVNKTNIKWGGFIEGIDEFDPLFFGISPREAALMDPQQRLLMTYVWKAVEDAGYSPHSLWGTKTGIFVGTAASGYGHLLSRANTAIEGYYSTGTVPSLGPNRMSYFLNLHGPSEPVETACSSSLVALHRAMVSLQTGACEMAIVGGVNTLVTPEAFISFNKAGMLCEDGRCKTFSDKANGYVRGEGVGMLFLKKLKDAEQAGDHIYGVIRGSAENHGGRANSLTAPNPKAQEELLKTVYSKAGIDPGTVGYIEAHGTGTELGDPIEIDGLKAAFNELYQVVGHERADGAHCGLGSVKSNIGHLELAAGVAGVIKVLLQLQHKTLVKSLHCDTVNPYIQLEGSPFYIARETREWKARQDSQGKDLPRRAGVSSFGFGGVNAHVVIEEYVPPGPKGAHDEGPVIIVLSAKDEERLKEQVRQLLGFIANPARPVTGSSLADIAYTLQVGREAMEERLAVMVRSITELREKLQGFLEDRDGVANLYRGQVKRNKDALAVFTADEDLEKAIDTWLSKGKYGKLPELWVQGLTFDWNKLYGASKPRRISMPTYPFARERYWISEHKNQPGRVSFPPRRQARFEEKFYDRLIDDVVNDAISIEAAVQKTKNFMD